MSSVSRRTLGMERGTFRSALTALALILVAGAAAFSLGFRGASSPAPLRVCADPNNLPFSNAAEEGFENAIAELVAGDLGQSVEYTWWPSRRGFLRATLNAGVCDVVMGVPEGLELVATTEPYYRSSYVVVARRDAYADLSSLDDPRLRALTIGLHVVGDDGASVPPAEALAARGVIDNVRGYSVYGDYAQPDPPAELIRAVGRGDIDVALAWGPLAGYFAAREASPLDVRPIEQTPDAALAFEIALGVRRDDLARRETLNDVLRRRATDIDRILDRFGVPRLAARQTPAPQALVGDPPGPPRADWPISAADAGAGNPFTGNLQALAQGRRFFVAYNCAGCHGDHGGGGMGPSLRDHEWIYGSSDAQIAASIAEGRAYGMPAWSRMLTPEQIWQITAYLKSLRTPEEPEPPR